MVKVLLLLLLPFATTFNIDEEFPIVIKDSFDGRDSHFGVSITLMKAHKSQADPHHAGPTGWILIGAPKANSTHKNHANINEPGVIWRCAIGRFPNLKEDDCRVLIMDPEGEYDPRHRPLPYKDKKDGSWLGGSMLSVGDGLSAKFVACSSRWINQKFKNDDLMNGICYWVNRLQITSDEIGGTWPLLPPEYSYRLMPLLNQSRAYYVHPHTNVQVKDWSFGQMGFSLAVSEYDELIVGAPGVFDWTGTVIQFKNAKEPRQPYRRYNANNSTPAFSEVFVAQIQNPNKRVKSFQYNDYLGYAVTSGKFFNHTVSQNRSQYAAGAPRASYTGRVQVFSFRETNQTSAATLDYLTDPVELNTDEMNRQSGSYFGSVLAAMDFNGDGYDDLIVGAPLFSLVSNNEQRFLKLKLLFEEDMINSDSEHIPFGPMEYGDEGCVFVYKSTGSDFNRNPQVICGDKIPGARFGTSLAVLGDVNMDGFNDLAVGAPYENNDHGAVYIYHGGLKELTFTQKLQPEKINPLIKTFGYSISTGMDIDGNSYPDFAVGAYQSNHAVIFRTIPIAKLKSNISSSIPQLLSSTREFNITTCISYTGINIPDRLEIRVKLAINHEPQLRRLITWVTPKSPSVPSVSNHIHSNYTLDPILYFKMNGSCHNSTVLRIGEIIEAVKPINITLEYSTVASDGTRPSATRPLAYEIMKNGSLRYNATETDFQRFSILKTPLSTMDNNKLELPVVSICEADGNPQCLANLSIAHYFFNKEDVLINELIVGSTDAVLLNLEIWNSREIAHPPIIVFLVWKSPPAVKKSRCDKINQDSSNRKHYKCLINRHISERNMQNVSLEFDVTKMYAGEVHDSEIEFNYQINSSSHLVQEAKGTFSLPLKFQMKLNDYRQEANSNATELEINGQIFNFSQSFEITLTGPTPIYSAQMELNIPENAVLNGKLHRLISVRSAIIVYDGDSNYSCEAIEGNFRHNFEFFELKQTPKLTNSAEIFGSEDYALEAQGTVYKRRRSISKRNVLFDTLQLLLGGSDKEEEGVLKVSCKDSSKIKCMKIACTVKYFHHYSKAVIDLKMRLKHEVAALELPETELMIIFMPAQLIKETSGVMKYLEIETHGKLRMLDTEGKGFGEDATVKVSTRIKLPQPYTIPLWIIIASIAAGLLIFTIITALLVKCGFFQRKTKEALENLMQNKND